MKNETLLKDLRFSFDWPLVFHHDALSGLVKVNGKDFEGTVTGINPETGLFIYTCRLSVCQPNRSVFEWASTNDNKIYSVLYFFEPNATKVTVYVPGDGGTCDDVKPFLLVGEAGKAVNLAFSHAGIFDGIAVSFTHSWLLHQFSSSKERPVDKAHFFRLLQSPHQRVLTNGEAMLCKTLFHEMQGQALAMEIKANVYGLLTFLYRHLRIKAYKDGKDQHEAVLLKMEQRIMSSLYGSLPPLQDVAKEFYTSFSSLNRHFKRQYGSTIYGYYLQQKMALAKKLVQEEERPVQTVALELGYESVTHFIAMFKKFHGVSPGKLKKENGNG